AVARINQAAAYPNSNVAVGFDYMFSGERMKSWDRTTISAGFDPSVNLSFPTKVTKAGEVALDQARAAGHRFSVQKFELQRRVLIWYFGLSLAGQRIQIARDDI